MTTAATAPAVTPGDVFAFLVLVFAVLGLLALGLEAFVRRVVLPNDYRNVTRRIKKGQY